MAFLICDMEKCLIFLTFLIRYNHKHLLLSQSVFLLLKFEKQVWGKSTIPSKFKSYFVYVYLLLTLFFAGYKADLRAHSIHLLSSFFTLITAFLFAILFGRGMYDDPLSGSYFAMFKYNLMHLLTAAPVPS